jgi:hypothetical protein
MTNQNKPICKLSGVNGNVFNLIAIAKKSLKKTGLKKESEEMLNKVFKADSYSGALAIIGEYVDII